MHRIDFIGKNLKELILRQYFLVYLNIFVYLIICVCILTSQEEQQNYFLLCYFRYRIQGNLSSTYKHNRLPYLCIVQTSLKKQKNGFLLCYLRFRFQGSPSSVFKHIRLPYHLCIALPSLEKQWNDFLLCYLQFRIQGNPSIYEHIHLRYHIRNALSSQEKSGMSSYCVIQFPILGSPSIYKHTFYLIICLWHWLLCKTVKCFGIVLFTF